MPDRASMSMRFAPGNSTLVMGHAVAVLAAANSDSSFVGRLRKLAEARDAGAPNLVDLLRSEPLAAMPDLAAVVIEGFNVRLFVRGAMVVEVVGADGVREAHSGKGLVTWSEGVVAGGCEMWIRESAFDVTGFDRSAYEAPNGILPAVAAHLILDRGDDPASKVGDRLTVAAEVGSQLEASELDHRQGTLDVAVDPPGDVRTPAGGETLLHPGDVFVADETPGSPPVDLRLADSSAASGAQELGVVSTTSDLPPDGTGSGSDATAAAPEASRDQVDAAPSDTGSYDDLFGSTMIRSVEGAAVRPVEADPDVQSAADDANEPTDPAHDGRTIMGEELRALRSREGVESPVTSTVSILAVHCSTGHPNPPHAATCRVCGIDIAEQEPELIHRPALARIAGTGRTPVPLDRTILIGRSPRLRGHVDDGAQPMLLAIDSPDKDVSRTHLEIRVEGWSLLATDLHSANGTTITSPGRPLVRLRPGEPHLIDIGTKFHLGDEVELRIEGP